MLNYPLRWQVIYSHPSRTWQVKPWFSTGRRFRAKPRASHRTWKTDALARSKLGCGGPWVQPPGDPWHLATCRLVKLLGIRWLKCYVQGFLRPYSLNVCTGVRCLFAPAFSFAEGDDMGPPGGSVVGHLPLAQGVIPGSWDRVPHRGPCREPASPSACVSASVSVSLMNK